LICLFVSKPQINESSNQQQMESTNQHINE